MLLDEVTTHIDTLDLPGSGTQVYAAGFPAAGSDDAIAVFEFAGGPPVRTKDSRTALSEDVRFQILCRSKRYITARETAESVMRELDGFRGEIEGTYYAQIRAMQSPFFLDKDEIGRTRIATNYRAVKEFSS